MWCQGEGQILAVDLKIIKKQDELGIGESVLVPNS